MNNEELQAIVKGLREERHLNPDREEVTFVPKTVAEQQKANNEARSEIENRRIEKAIMEGELSYLMTEASYSTPEQREAARKGKHKWKFII